MRRLGSLSVIIVMTTLVYSHSVGSGGPLMWWSFHLSFLIVRTTHVRDQKHDPEKKKHDKQRSVLTQHSEAHTRVQARTSTTESERSIIGHYLVSSSPRRKTDCIAKTAVGNAKERETEITPD